MWIIHPTRGFIHGRFKLGGYRITQAARRPVGPENGSLLILLHISG
jgi:hypothetical protein